MARLLGSVISLPSSLFFVLNDTFESDARRKTVKMYNEKSSNL